LRVKGRTGKDWVEVKLEEIDWESLSTARRRSDPLANRVTYYSTSHPTATSHRTDVREYDLILAVDCIYNEHLVQPLVDTIAHYCPAGGKTVVWVVVELRSADVVRVFSFCVWTMLIVWIAHAVLGFLAEGPEWALDCCEASGGGDGELGGEEREMGWVGWMAVMGLLERIITRGIRLEG